MIPQLEKRDVVSSGADDSVSFEISAKDTAHIMTILRDTLYSDKIMAVLREYGTNAWDANKMAGRGDVPIEVTLPTLGKPELVIRDRGPGLSHVDIRRVYTQYGASTKREDNVAAGMLGIGSKSGFAYSDSFTITSWHGGAKRVYIAVIDKTEKGRCDLMLEEPCDPAETGVEINVPVKPQDCAAFEDRAKRLFVHFVPRPKINCGLPPAMKGKAVGDLGTINETEAWEGRGIWHAIMGPVAYKIDLNQLGGFVNGHSLARAAHNIGGLLPFDIGVLQIAASREHLKYGDATKEALITRINAIIDEYVVVMLSDIDKLPNWEKRLRIRSIERKGLPVPLRYKWDADYVSLKPQTLIAFSTRNYNERMVPATAIHVDSEYRLVIRDEKRTKAMSGYELKENKDIVVSAKDELDLTAAEIRLAVDRLCSDLKIDGIPVVLLSSIKWNPPIVKSTGKPRDTVRAKTRHFVLDPSKPFYDDSRAELWTPVDRNETGDDVYVVLQSYRVEGMEGFYDTYRADEQLLAKFGLKMPPIYGHKTTQAKPVDVSKLKGVEYRKWRKTGMVKLLLAIPNISAIVQAAGYETTAGYYEFDLRWLETQLGKDHPIYEYATAENGGKMMWSKASTDVKLAATHVRNCMMEEDFEATKKRREILKAYPLVKTTGVRVFKELHKEAWIDYVKLVDRDSAARAAARKQQEAA